MASTSTNRVLKSPLHSPVNLHMEIILKIHLITILYRKRNRSLKQAKENQNHKNIKQKTTEQKKKFSCVLYVRDADACLEVQRQYHSSGLIHHQIKKGQANQVFQKQSEKLAKACTDKEGRKEEKKFLWIFILVNMRKLHKKLRLEGNLVYL